MIFFFFYFSHQNNKLRAFECCVPQKLVEIRVSRKLRQNYFISFRETNISSSMAEIILKLISLLLLYSRYTAGEEDQSGSFFVFFSLTAL